MSKTSILLIGILLFAWGCGGGGGQTTPPASISVTLTPSTANVHVTRSTQLTATVHNSTNSTVTWSVSGTGCNGTTCGTISSAGLYTAPASVPSPATITVTATSAADTSKSASATITILAAVVVTVSPLNQSVVIGSTQQYTATVQNAINSSVTWSVSGSACTGSACGTISTTGLYTAPSVVPSAPAVSITATSVEDTAKSDSVTATIVLSVSNGEWTWVSGSNTANQWGIYGIQSTADPSNVPGARFAAVSWIDANGKFLLFGGFSLDMTHGASDFNDLWKYDPATLEWTWVSGSNTVNQAGVYGTQGTADPSNVPGARADAVSWIDASGKLWLFGGLGPYDYLNDLWKYDPTTLEWTWVSGSNTVNQAGVYGTQGTADPSNVPGARADAVSWIDASGKLWLFGGNGYDSASGWGSLNDLWKYDPTTLEWTWVSGSNAADQAGIYGTQGTADPSNVPGARFAAVSWIDASGKLWLFGGLGYYSTTVSVGLNDLWKYDPTTLEWTWVSGSNTGNQAGTYGTQGTADPSNVPGARCCPVSWIDAQGKLWLFGGSGYDSGGYNTYLNDLWKYDPTTLEWTWVSGSNSGDQTGIYGTRGTAAASNVPGAREIPVSWIDSSGRLWFFGGVGIDSAGYLGYLNDLWKYIR
jgi:N-acetylneuraminic acid mutarotase